MVNSAIGCHILLVYWTCLDLGQWWNYGSLLGIFMKKIGYCLFGVVVDFHRCVFLSYLKVGVTLWGNLFVLIMWWRRLDESSKGVRSTLWCLLRTFAITLRSYVSHYKEWGFCQEVAVYSNDNQHLYEFDVTWIVQDIRHKLGRFNFFIKFVILNFLQQ